MMQVTRLPAPALHGVNLSCRTSPQRGPQPWLALSRVPCQKQQSTCASSRSLRGGSTLRSPGGSPPTYVLPRRRERLQRISSEAPKKASVGTSTSTPLSNSNNRNSNSNSNSNSSALQAASSDGAPAAAPSPSPSPTPSPSPSQEYTPSPLDDLFLTLFRRKLVKETGWKSPQEGYSGMIEEARRLLNMSSDRSVAEAAAVRILLSFFPPGLLPLFKRFIAPALDGKLGPILSAMVTLVTCQWLMGPSKSSEVQLPDGTMLRSGVKIEKCRFLEETKCAGSCIHTCKMPTQAFMQEHMGVPLYMEPNFDDYSCEFKFGVPAPLRGEDEALRKPCLAVCPTASARPQDAVTCPEVYMK